MHLLTRSDISDDDYYGKYNRKRGPEQTSFPSPALLIRALVYVRRRMKRVTIGMAIAEVMMTR